MPAQVHHAVPDGGSILGVPSEVVQHREDYDVETFLGADATAAEHLAEGLPDVEVGVLEDVQHDVELVLAQPEVAADLPEAADGVEADCLDLVVQHVDEEILRQFREGRRVGRQLAERVHRGVPHLEQLVLESVHEGAARSAGNERHRVRVDIVLRRVVGPLLARRPLAGLVAVALPRVRAPLVPHVRHQFLVERLLQEVRTDVVQRAKQTGRLRADPHRNVVHHVADFTEAVVDESDGLARAVDVDDVLRVDVAEHPDQLDCCKSHALVVVPQRRADQVVDVLFQQDASLVPH